MLRSVEDRSLTVAALIIKAPKDSAMKKKALVLGAGMVGATIARDLAADDRLHVTAADVSQKNLDRLAGTPNLTPLRADLGSPNQVRALVKDFDVVAGALPSTLGLQTLRAVIEAGKPYVDISFMAEDPLSLDALARERRTTAVVDCGVAPGLANMIIGHVHAALDRTDDVAFYVGGLPKQRCWPYLYKAPFAPADVLEEYTRPVRLVENGRVVVKTALSEPELIDFPRVGTLEAFNTDGLRSLIRTINAPNMKEKTLRHPGHLELMRVLRETGFFSKDEIDVRGAKVRPLDVTSKLLFPMWTLQPGEEEFTILRVIVEGVKNRSVAPPCGTGVSPVSAKEPRPCGTGISPVSAKEPPSCGTGVSPVSVKDGRRLRYVYDLYDEYDAKTDQTSMARTTGFPCAIVARMLAFGEFAEPGVFPPELLALRHGLFDRVTRDLAARGVNLTHHTEEIETSPAAL
jgi:lysine 6-dehydrogenase